MNKIISCFFLLLLNLASLSLSAVSYKPLTESSKVSLLTCSPNDEAIYSLFGHSGLRISDDSLGIDVVFDYGIFDFESDNFIYRFVKGETDYIVAARRFDQFLWSYNNLSVEVKEQIFNLNLQERQKIFDALWTNSLPENRVYRYNFFYDNCATRPRDIIADNINGKVEFVKFTEEQTYRDLLDECLRLTPWSRFGINLVIGSDADKIITERQKDFLPDYVSRALSIANIVDSHGNSRRLIKNTEILLEATDMPLVLIKSKENKIEATNYPLIVGGVLLLLSIFFSYLGYTRRIKRGFVRLFDSILFFLVGCAGLIIFFLMFFSEHPCVDKNWNLVWLNPLPLLVIPFFFVKRLTKYVISYHFINFVALSLLLVGFNLIPQVLEFAFIPYILLLAIRSGENMCFYRKEKRIN